MDAGLYFFLNHSKVETFIKKASTHYRTSIIFFLDTKFLLRNS